MTIDLQSALTIVRAAGYRVTKPQPPKRKSFRVGPTCVARINGEVYRMTTHCDDVNPDFKRGLRLCQLALSSRQKISVDVALTMQPQSIHFERNGEIIATRG